MCMPPNASCQGTHTTLCNILMPCPIMMSHMNTPMMSFMMTSLHHRHHPLKARHSTYWGSFLGSLQFLSPQVRYSCMQGLTHPHFWSLLPSKIINWLLFAIAVSIHTTSTPLHILEASCECHHTVMCGYTPLTIRETETLMSNGLYI